VNLKPLADRVLIKPEIPPNVTESGLIIQEDRKPEQTGTVVAVGPVIHPRKAEAEALANRLDEYEPFDTEDLPPTAGATMLRDLVRKEPEVKVGDYVVFSWTAGQEIWVEDGADRYLLMRESDILCVVEGLEA
jgi:co-chaperonin GroES (HSP10)